WKALVHGAGQIEDIAIRQEAKLGSDAVTSGKQIIYVDSRGVAIPAQEGSVFRGTAVTPEIDASISQSGHLSGQARGVTQNSGAALPNDAPLMARIPQYVEG